MFQTVLGTPLSGIGQLHVLSLSSLTGLDRRMLHGLLSDMVKADGAESTLGQSLGNLFTSPDSLKLLLRMLSGPNFKFGKTKISDVVNLFGDTVCRVTGMAQKDFDALKSFLLSYSGPEAPLAEFARMVSEDPDLLDIASKEFQKKILAARETDITEICNHCGSVNIYEGVPVSSQVFLCRECGLPIIL